MAIQNREEALHHQQKRKALINEMSKFQIRKLTEILQNNYFDMLESGSLDEVDVKADLADFELEVENVISEIEEYREKCTNLINEFIV